MSNAIIKHGVLSRLGFFINKQLLNTRILAGSISAVLLTGISTVFNYQFGLMLSSDDPISQSLLPIGYSCLDIGALFIGGYIGLCAKNYLSKIVGFLWLLVLISLSLFTAWSFQCAIDHKKISHDINSQIYDLESDLARYQNQIESSIKEKENTKFHKNKAIYQAEIDKASEQIDIKRLQLLELKSKNIEPEYAVFYRTPILKKHPEEYMTIVRFIFSGAVIFTPFVILYLMGIESTKQPHENKTKTHKRKDFFRSIFYQNDNVAGVGKYDSTVKINHGKNMVNDKLYERIKNDILTGKVRPSCRAIDKKYTISSRDRTAIMQRLKSENVLIIKGRGYALNEQVHSISNVIPIR